MWARREEGGGKEVYLTLGTDYALIKYLINPGGVCPNRPQQLRPISRSEGNLLRAKHPEVVPKHRVVSPWTTEDSCPLSSVNPKKPA